MRQQRAFDVLGIELTNDHQLIRKAFTRLARIYHPDRFVDQPDDVRAEAERRMKDAIAAYDSLRNTRRTAESAAASARTPRTRNPDPWEEARRAREAILLRQAEIERSRARWLLWEELERQARERADSEAHFAGTVADDLTVVRKRRGSSEAGQEDDRWNLNRRLERAKGDRNTPAKR